MRIGAIYTTDIGMAYICISYTEAYKTPFYDRKATKATIAESESNLLDCQLKFVLKFSHIFDNCNSLL